MKKSIKKSSGLFLILVLCCISIIGNSQDLKLSKKEQKEARKAERLKEYEVLGTLLESRKFVFEGTRKQNKEGMIVTINPALNFVRFDSLKINMNLERMGDEWMPNVTLLKNNQPMSGNISHWELLKNSKKLNYYLILRSTPDYPSMGSFNFTMRINADKSAVVRLNVGRKSDFNEFHGYIKAL